METNTLNAWLRANGYHWVQGKEEMHKSQLTATEAADLISQLAQRGAISQ